MWSSATFPVCNRKRHEEVKIDSACQVPEQPSPTRKEYSVFCDVLELALDHGHLAHHRHPNIPVCPTLSETAMCDPGVFVALALVSTILAISLCLNAILYSLRRRDARRKAVEEYPCPEPEAYHMDSPEVTLDQENHIYGNINPDRAGAGGAGGGGEVFYEHMTTRSRQEKPPQQDVSYASLDLVVGQKRRKKHRNKQNPKPGQSWAEHPSQQDFLEVEVEVEMEPGMPCRNSSPMISRNSIYLNSHQVAMESEELERRLEREREREDLMDFDNVHDDPTRFFTRANQSQAFDTDSR